MRWTRDGNLFQLRVDVGPSFGPDSVKVLISSLGDLIVRAGHDELIEQDGHVSRSFVGRIAIPMHLDTESLVTSLSADGTLVVTAKQLPIGNEKIIPIFPADPHGHLSDHPRVSPGGP